MCRVSLFGLPSRVGCCFGDRLVGVSAYERGHFDGKQERECLELAVMVARWIRAVCTPSGSRRLPSCVRVVSGLARAASDAAPRPVVRFERLAYPRVMAGALAQETAQTLRTAFDEALRDSTNVPTRAREALDRLLDVLEAHNDAVVFPVDATLSTQEVAALLGVSRMTVVRLIDRGTLAAENGAVHRRIAVSEVARYQHDSTRRRRSAMAALADGLDQNMPPDEVMNTR